MEYLNRETDPDILYHFGRKGMKWGQHIFGKVKSHKRKKQQQQALEKAREVRKTKQEEAKEREEKRAKLLKSTDASELYKNRDLLTTAEINERLNRIDTERRLGQVAESTRKSGMDRVNKALQVGRKINEVYEFTNTPVMKALKKQLGITKAEEKLGLDKIYAMKDKMSDKQLADALKRASTEKALKKILDENAAEAKAAAQKQVDEYNAKLQKENEPDKSSPYSKSGDELTDARLVVDTPMSEVRNSEQALIGQTYIAGLLEDKSK